MSSLICVNTAAAAAAAEKTICEVSKERKREKREKRVSSTPNFVRTRITFQLVDHLTHCFVLSFVSA